MKLPYVNVVSLPEPDLSALTPLPGSPYRGIGPFVSRVGARLEPLVGQAMTRSLEADAQYVIDLELREAKARNDLLMWADGVVLTGGTPVVRDHVLGVRWATAFWPRPRYVTEDGWTPLGFFNEFDLYLMPQAPLPTTIVARFGSAPSDYLTANPSLSRRQQVEASGAHFAEAMWRLDMLGLIGVV